MARNTALTLDNGLMFSTTSGNNVSTDTSYITATDKNLGIGVGDENTNSTFTANKTGVFVENQSDGKSQILQLTPNTLRLVTKEDGNNVYGIEQSAKQLLIRHDTINLGNDKRYVTIDSNGVYVYSSETAQGINLVSDGKVLIKANEIILDASKITILGRDSFDLNASKLLKITTDTTTGKLVAKSGFSSKFDGEVRLSDNTTKNGYEVVNRSLLANVIQQVVQAYNGHMHITSTPGGPTTTPTVTMTIT